MRTIKILGVIAVLVPMAYVIGTLLTDWMIVGLVWLTGAAVLLSVGAVVLSLGALIIFVARTRARLYRNEGEYAGDWADLVREEIERKERANQLEEI